jgi:transcriptional regulator with XRE-family HTH domain
MEVGRLTLKDARDARAWSQQRLEDETAQLGLKVDQRNISKIESGVIEDPSNSTVEVLELALGLSRGTLVFVKRLTRVA